MNLNEYLREAGADEGLISVIESVFEGIKKISHRLRTTDIGKVGSHNSFGEEQIAMDVYADQVLSEILRENENVSVYTSEESAGELNFDHGEYAVCSDPLDGSSLVDVNLAVGTIVGIYKAQNFANLKGKDQHASLMSTYGPQTTVFLTIKKGVLEFLLNEKGEFVLRRRDFQIGPGKMFAPGNLRAAASREDYFKLTNYWIENQYTLRYSGGMVPDVGQILIKGKGIFSYPGYDEMPEGKLRLLFECAPLALLVQEAGGAASDGKMPILEKEIKDLHQTTPVYLGSKEEVDRCEQYLS